MLFTTTRTVASLVLVGLGCLVSACGTEANPSGDTSGALAAAPAAPDGVACSDGKNSWAMDIPRPQGGTSSFRAIALMSTNLFSIRTIVADRPPTSFMLPPSFPDDVSKATGLVLAVAFKPPSDGAARADAIASRNRTLLELRDAGVTIDCDPVLRRRGDPAPQPGPDDVDAIGCGDGMTAPNSWGMSIKKTDDNARLVHTLALVTMNLFTVDKIGASFDSSADQAGPVDVDKATGLNLLVRFLPGRNSPALPTIEQDSIANRDRVLDELKQLEVKVACAPSIPQR